MTMGTSWPFGERDYRAIEEALMRSDYGPWFLGEYLARNRSEETERLLEALERLEASFADAACADPLSRLREIAEEIDSALSTTLSSLEAPENWAECTDDTNVDRILEAVEDINGFIETLQSRRVHLRLPEKIRDRLKIIQAACARVDETQGDRPGLVALLADLRQRLAGVSQELAAPSPPAADVEGTDPRIPRRVIDELANAFFRGGETPAAG